MKKRIITCLLSFSLLFQGSTLFLSAEEQPDSTEEPVEEVVEETEESIAEDMPLEMDESEGDESEGDESEGAESEGAESEGAESEPEDVVTDETETTEESISEIEETVTENEEEPSVSIEESNDEETPAEEFEEGPQDTNEDLSAIVYKTGTEGMIGNDEADADELEPSEERESFTLLNGTNYTQSEAVSWITARRNEGWANDYDGVAGAQCVDLIKYYMDWLVGFHYNGNGYDYVSRSLPDGWSYKSYPSPGDIAVWGAWKGIAREYGHVALVEYVGNGTFGYVDVNGGTGRGGSGSLSNSNPTTFIHPDFKPGVLSVSFEPWSNDKFTYIGETDASIGMQMNVSGGNPTDFGMVLMDRNNNYLAEASNGSFYYRGYFKINEELHYTLKKSTIYHYKYYVIVDGVAHWDVVRSFQTYPQIPYVEVNNITLSQSSLTIEKGKTATLTATVLPNNATNKDVTWSSSNTNIATVANGVVTAKNPGTATITVKSNDSNITASCKVTVANPGTAVTGVSLNKTSLTIEKGKTGTLTATVSPGTATNKAVTWSSSNTNVATVSNGTVTGKNPGTAVITVTTTDGKKTAKCTVTVNEDNVVAFVTRLYKLCLNRNPDGPGLNDWVSKLKNKQITAADAVQGFFYSNEMNNLKLSDDAWIERCYQVMMGRNSDPSGKAYWKAVLSEQMKKDVLKGFIDSNEFIQICKDYGITKGTISDPAGLQGFVARCYNKVLRRDYDQGGLNYWVSEINGGTSYGKTKKERAINVASRGFFNSQEYLNRKTGNEVYVKTLYRTFLGREADATGMKDWLGKLNTGKMNRNQVLMGFAGSQEFLGILKSYGIS